MKKLFIYLALLPCALMSHAQNATVKTIAGTGVTGYSGDGGSALSAMINITSSHGIAADNSGNVYFSDATNNVVRKISSTGIITTIAGTGVAGFSGDGGPAILAKMSLPADMTIDNSGNIYIVDNYNFRIRKINTAGVISTVGGNGSSSSSGDGGPATAAAFWPSRINVDNAGNIYIVDGVHARIRMINVSTGIITTVAGTGVSGFSGDGGAATAAQINAPGGVAVDAAGNIYIADGSNYRIRKVNTSGIISTYAGTGLSGYSGDGGPALSAQFTGIYRLDVDPAGNLYLADRDNLRIRKISNTGIISTLAGGGSMACGVNNIPALSAYVNLPLAVCSDDAGRVYYFENGCPTIRMVSSTPDIISDSFSVYINKLCSGPDITVVAAHPTTGMSVKTWFGDGTNSTTAFTGSYAHLTHTYQHSGNYTMKYVLYSGATALDSAVHTFNYLLCNSLPVAFYYDGNNNCKKDSTAEPNINLPVLAAVDSNGITIDTISAMSGAYYNAYGSPGDIYNFRVISYPAGLQFSCAGTGIIRDTLTGSAYFAPTKSVGFNCNTSTSFDLREFTATISRPSYQEGTILIYNDFCAPQNATVTLQFSDKYVFQHATPAPIGVTGHTATWLLTGVSTYKANQTNIHYTLVTPGSVLIPGDTVMSRILVTPTSGDIIVSNNSEIRVDTVKGSFDPNEMHVSPAGYIASGTQLKYTVTFENTGNDTAHNIYVLDTLSDHLIPTSLRIVAASADMQVNMHKAGGHNVIRFDFPNIMLPDSSHHDLCHGSVIFTIDTKPGLASGTGIYNRAGIYFDENEVVLTNTVEDIIGFPTLAGTLPADHYNVQLYPNPVDNLLTIKTELNAYSTYTISNSIGQVMAQDNIQGTHTDVDTRLLPAGMYHIMLKGDHGTRVQKFVKQ